jgi:hypothetical protein
VSASFIRIVIVWLTFLALGVVVSVFFSYCLIVERGCSFWFFFFFFFFFFLVMHILCELPNF